MRTCGILASIASLIGLACLPAAEGPVLEQEANTWVKRSPLKGGPVSPGMGYEAALAYDPFLKRVIRWGGHNQGGGGEQNAETWVYDPTTARWELKEPNTSPPGVCCAQQHVFDTVGSRFLRFPAFSGSHGWQWFREIYLSNSTLWTYDLAANTWRDMRPAPAPRVGPLRCASWDSAHQAAVVFGGEGIEEGTVVYDPYTNTWTRMRPKSQPASRSGGNMAYDAAHGLHVLFGSQFSNDPHTWTYDLRKNEWTDCKPAVQPSVDRNDAVLAYDAASQKVIALVRVIDKQEKDEVVQGHLETWSYDAGRNEWKQMKPAKEPPGWHNRRRILTAIPDQNVILLENYINPTDRVPDAEREQQVWTYRLQAIPARDPMPLPEPPTEVRVTTTATEVVLSWLPSPTQTVLRYRILRGEGPVPWTANMAEVAAVVPGQKQRLEWRDPDRKPGTIYHYAIQAIAKEGNSRESIKVRSQPRVVEDAVVSVIGPRETALSWSAPTGGDVAGYHVERAAVDVLSEDQVLRLKKDTAPLAEPSVGAIRAIGPFTRLTREPLREPSFRDTTIDLTKPQAIEGEPVYTSRFRADQLDPKGKPYRFAVFAYRIRAVNALGVESGPSPWFLTIPSSPRFVFAREEEAMCHLKWQVNPEKELRGYRVYRMEGPKINGPGQPVTRLTADPLTKPLFTDNQATRDTKRYWVVAVDALGQEGIPSAPAWHYRQFRRYYEPFVGAWHQ
jgi:hypothetical protein